MLRSSHRVVPSLLRSFQWNKARPASTIATALRTHSCGELRGSEHTGQKVQLAGWVDAIRPFGPLSFVTLRDRHGIVQLKLQKDELAHLEDEISALRPEGVIQVQGTVQPRPDDMKNANQSTGDIEVIVSSIQHLNTPPSALPLQVSSNSPRPNEDTNLRHRFLSLRRSELQKNLKLRSDLMLALRQFFIAEHDFLEVETPTLFKSTPEGAREFLVPTREQGLFYALTQSPQQYKQLLMVGGADRYFQVARCYRDESGRADRQPEFTQIDVEMSFVERQDVMDVMESLAKKMWAVAGQSIANLDSTNKVVHMTFAEAMQRFGVDKPDTRFGMELEDLHGLDQSDFVQKFGADKYVRGINAKTLASQGFSRKDMDSLLQRGSTSCDTKLFGVTVGQDGQWSSSLKKMFKEEEQAAVNGSLKGEEGDVLLLAIGSNYNNVSGVLGRMRTHVASVMYDQGKLQKELDPTHFHLLWIIDFPLFELDNDEYNPQNLYDDHRHTLSSTHHPFTCPHPEDLATLESLLAQDKDLMDDDETIAQLVQIKAQHFDLVCNGWELGGGSMRIHNAELQTSIFDQILHLSPAQKQSFSHLIEALGYGAPPHGGMAMGLDRVVALLSQSKSLREVIAFPKSAAGRELMTNSPGPVEASQLAEYHVQVHEKK